MDDLPVEVMDVVHYKSNLGGTKPLLTQRDDSVSSSRVHHVCEYWFY